MHPTTTTSNDEDSARTIDLLRHWSKQQPTQPVITAYPTRTPDAQIPDRTRISRPDTTLTIGW